MEVIHATNENFTNSKTMHTENENHLTNGYSAMVNGHDIEEEVHVNHASEIIKVLPEVIVPEKNVSPVPEEKIPKPKSPNGVAHKQSQASLTNGVYLSGPDQIIPADNILTTNPCDRVKLKMGEGLAASAPYSVPGLLSRTTLKYPNKVAMAYKRIDGSWVYTSYKEYREQVRTCAKAFLKLGLKRYHSVCILGFNSPEWFISDLAAIHAGGFAAGIYTTNSPEACFYCAENSRANIIVVEDKKQLDKILLIKDRLPELKAIVQYQGTVDTPGVLSWNDLMNIGASESDVDLESVLKSLSINECCTLVYTSGTVGNPKAVMLSHDNLTWNALIVAKTLNVSYGSDIVVSYLPLSHIAAQLVDIYLVMSFAGTTYFADKNALKGSLMETLAEARPTYFLGVPRVYEKIQEKMLYIGSQSGSVKRMIASWAKGHGLQHNMKKINGSNSLSLGYIVANMLIFKRIKKILGLDRCKAFFSAAAPLAPEVKKYFMSIDIPIMEAFGMSETSGAHTIGSIKNYSFDSVGMQMKGVSTKIDNPDELQQGEILMAGRHIFMGYLNEPEKSREAIDEQGWLHSGDLGRLTDKNLLYITGRLKELLITAGGENIPPVLIEHTVLAELPCVSNAFLIGDKRKFLSMLITLKANVNLETGEPLDELTPATLDWCKSLGCDAKTVSEIVQKRDKAVYAAIQEGIDRANDKAISNAQKIQKFEILTKDFSIPTGELGPTMKIKRNIVCAKYAEVIERFYSN